MPAPERLVVGYDGSDTATLAVRWAARLAACANAELEVVHCSIWPLLTSDLGPVRGIAGSGLLNQAKALLEQGTAEARAVAPTAAVRSTLLYGLPAAHLRRISENARMLVLGSRGAGGFMGLLVGSVSLELTATASCPVAVVRFDRNPEGRIVVGLDGSGSAGALGTACGIAAAAHAELLVIHVSRPYHGPAGQPDATSDAGARRLLRTAIEEARTLAPEVIVSQELAHDTSVPRALLNASRGASLTVVGSRGHGIVRGTLGSTAHAVLHHATGPVLIARQPRMS